MKTNATGIALLSGLLLSAPTFAQISEMTSEKTSFAQGALFVSSDTFTAQGSLGMTRQVLLAVRVTKNMNTNFNSCSPAAQADSITIEMLDDKTKKVLGVAKRMFGNIRHGNNELFRNSNTYDCIADTKSLSLSLNGSSLTITDNNGFTSAISIEGATVTLPAKLTFKK